MPLRTNSSEVLREHSAKAFEAAKAHTLHYAFSRTRLWYGTIEWMMIMESSPCIVTSGIGISSQLLGIMPWYRG